MAIMNTAAAPMPEIRATIVIIHHSKPELCPDCQAKVELPCDASDNVPAGVVAWRCSGKGHRIHAFLETQQ